MVSVLGIREVKFKPKDGGETVSGFRVYASDDSFPHMVCGVGCFDFFLSDDKSAKVGLKDLHPGDEIELVYNRFGKVDNIIIE